MSDHQPPADLFARVVIVRHGCAGNKSDWRGDDSVRPLDDGGIEQAQAIAGALCHHDVRRLVASPTARCVDTLGPLSSGLGLDIGTDERLAPDGAIDHILHDDPPSLSGTVICTHGELMRPLLDEIHRRGVAIHAEHRHDEWLLAKGSVWHLTLGPDGQVTSLRHEAPRPLPACGPHTDSG